MRLRIRDILLVSSLYDLYVFEEDGRLYELIRDQYQKLNLTHAPELTRVSSGREGIALAKEERRFDLIITTLHIEDMKPTSFAKKIREENIDIPIVLLAFDNRELSDLLRQEEASVFDQIFIWQGDFRLLIAIIKHLEDRLNVEHDTKIVGVQSIILIEDNIWYYSYFLPIIYLEIMRQSQRLISEGINLSHKQLRQRARTKILLCNNYEEAWNYYTRYKDTILGIISDIDFPHNGKMDPQAGFDFAENVQKQQADIPILLHSTLPENEKNAKAIGASFIVKDSPTLLEDLRTFMTEYLSFGDFVFRTPDGHEVARAHDLLSLEKELHTIPDESMEYHAERNHYSNWLKARTEFWLAHQLRPRKVSDFPSITEMRKDLIASLKGYRKLRQRGIITEFDKESFDPYSSISKIGGGFLGGKARGLSFINIIINNYNVQNRFKGVRIYIPPAIIIGTDIFDQFLEENNLRNFALNTDEDGLILKKFIEAKKFPEEILGELSAFLDIIDRPLAVRSSSLLEDSHNHPFAGVYKTYMLPNSHSDLLVRLGELVKAIKRVYASTFFQSAKNYIRATSYRLEDEKMAVIVQKMIGTSHHNRFYPDFSGVARSYNFYPVPPQKSSDGIASLALGLGKMVMEGGSSVRFCPKYPAHMDQFGSKDSLIQNSQKDFFALDLDGINENKYETKDRFVKKYALKLAEENGVLFHIGSTYSPENDMIYDGTSKEGIRLVTFAPILKNKIFPLAEILDLILDMGMWGMGTPVEIEFAVDLSEKKEERQEFGLLQMRPMAVNPELEVLKIEDYDYKDLICQSDQVLGNGLIDTIYDIVMVDRNLFDRSKSNQVAQEIKYLNTKLVGDKRRYLLIGVGRWGTLDPWLGIPVTWDQIANAKVIIETGFRDFVVEPSQGSHFFQNLNTFMVGYFTVKSESNHGFVDWDWLLKQPVKEKLDYTRHIEFQKPLVVKMSGHHNKGVVIKPEG
ncbi:histidine kinase [bacterium]|nr:histidine kinase [bacterium]RQV93834.1 MAG: response regulator [bacterium]